MYFKMTSLQDKQKLEVLENHFPIFKNKKKMILCVCYDVLSHIKKKEVLLNIYNRISCKSTMLDFSQPTFISVNSIGVQGGGVGGDPPPPEQKISPGYASQSARSAPARFSLCSLRGTPPPPPELRPVHTYG